MILNKLIFGFFCLTIILAHPLLVKRDESRLSIRATRPAPPQPAARPAAKSPSKPVLYTGNSPVDQARKANLAPGREAPKKCTKLTDCSCPNQSTSCINGWCSCNNAAANFFAKQYVEVAKEAGNSTPVKVIGHVMQGLSDAKEVLGVVASTVLGPVGKFATKVALQAFPDTGPSHIDQFTGGILKKIPGL